MSTFTDILETLAPTVATAVAGPLGGAAVSAIGSILGISQPTQKSIESAFQSGQMTPEQVAGIKQLELQYQNDEKERNFKYAELVYKDVDSARQLGIATKSQTPTILSYIVLGAGGALLFSVVYGYAKADSVIVGSIIGYAVGEMKQVLTYWFGSSQGSVANRDALIDATKSQNSGGNS